MKDGKWLQPNYASLEIFEKDYPKIDFSGIDVYCPGCKSPVKMSRQSPIGRIGGWCRKCNKGVMP